MLFPKKVKFRKWHKTRNRLAQRHADTRGTTISFGSFAVMAAAPARIRSNQIESARRVISRTLGKTGRVWIRVFPDRPWTQKAAEVPMGKGKGDPQGFEVQVLPGRVLFEVDGVPEATAKEAMRKAGAKLPMKTKFVTRD
jgi:large subunit ribosomal protein L16